MSGGRKPNTLAKFWAQILKDDCWIWTGPINSTTGYGCFSLKTIFDRPIVNTHVMAYELLVGPIPEGHELHHTCRNRRCCNPLHLKLVTVAEHRTLEPHTNGYEKRTHCLKGHPYDEANTYHYVIGSHNRRGCRQCRKEHQRAFRSKMKALT
jgi:hypothetical protein